MIDSLIRFGDRLLLLFVEYIRIIIIIVFLALALGMLVKIANNLIDLEVAVLKLELEACRIEQNDIDVVKEALDNSGMKPAEIESWKVEIDRHHTFVQQMKKLDRIDRDIDATHERLEEL
jgi:hypothetical protein